MATKDGTQFLTVLDLNARYGVGRGWIERRIRHSNFPKPVRLGGAKYRFWREADVIAWEAATDNHPRPATNVGAVAQ